MEVLAHAYAISARISYAGSSNVLTHSKEQTKEIH